LVNNAVDHVSKQAVEITIRVDEDLTYSKMRSNGIVKKQHKSGIFTVKDNRIAIKPEKMEGLFKKFYQIDAAL
jgi:signal transduction histidine kinase